MTAKSTRVDVPYSAEQMYALVADIERYPEFLPWCVALRVLSNESAPPLVYQTADMVVAYRVFRERFRTRVTLDAQGRRISARYVDGPFHSLTTDWRFQPLPRGSRILFDISFEFRNILMQATARAVFERAFARMAEAFVERAGAVYGK